MPRPKNKSDLLSLSNSNFEKLRLLIDSLWDNVENQTFTFEDRDKNIRDVLVHLYEWHQLMIHFISENVKWNNVSFLPSPYNWKTYPQMNVEIRNKHQNTDYADAVKMLKESHKIVIQLIDWFSDEELFIKKYFNWTWTTNLWSYFISSTSSHYDRAINKIKKHKKSLN